MAIFYQDIIEHIVHHLQDDKLSLTNLRLASSLWDAPCLAMIFRRLEFVILDPFDYAREGVGGGGCLTELVSSSIKRCEDLLALFRARPNLANIPKKFSLVRAHRVQPSIWDQLEHVHTTIFLKLRSIQEVDFGDVHFAHLSNDCMEALLGICRQPTVTHLTLTTCIIDDSQVLQQIVLSPEYLQHLNLSITATFLNKETCSEVGPEPEEESADTNKFAVSAGGPSQASQPQRHRARLKTLVSDHRSLIALHQCLLQPQSGLDLSELKAFRIGHAGDGAAFANYLVAASHIFAVCAKSLTSLVAEQPSGVNAIKEDQIQVEKLLCRLHNVTTVCFEGMFFSNRREENSLALLVASISRMDQISRLQTLKVRTNVKSIKGYSIDWTCWAPLDEGLSNRLIFTSFECLDVCLYIRDARYADNHRMLLEKQLPKLIARGCLKISVGV